MAVVATADPFSGEPLPMLDEKSRIGGGYGDVVTGLRARLWEARAAARLDEAQPLKVMVFGHGGRDTNCFLALVEAVARDEGLRGTVSVHPCTCSWPDDEWECIMESYVGHLRDSGAIAPGAVEFSILKFHEDHNKLLARLAGHLKGKHIVLQCEQGVDLFVEPVTCEWLQDNYEDNVVHAVCMEHAERAGIPSLLLQTNTDLDLSRGVDGEDLMAHIFRGKMQTGAFLQNIEFKGESLAGQPPPKTVIGLAVAIGEAPNKQEAFRRYLNIDPADHVTLPSFYAAYIAYSAKQTNAALPVAGVLEVIVTLVGREGHDMPWSSSGEVPQPQWVLARFLVPYEVEGARLRILTQFRAARMDSARSMAEYLSRWMAARNCRRLRRHNVSAGSRFTSNFWRQLVIARDVADTVKAHCPSFSLWDGGDVLLTRALTNLGDAVKSNKSTRARWARIELLARQRQPDFELCPVWMFVQGGHKTILDFTCRLLESPRGVEEEFSAIASGLPERPATGMVDSNPALAELLREHLILAWHALHPAALVAPKTSKPQRGA